MAPIDITVYIPNEKEDIRVGSLRVNPSYVDQVYILKCYKVEVIGCLLTTI
jgi:hypothetical protein